MAKYKINREFFPFSHFTPPISERALAFAVPLMKVPRFLFGDKALRVRRYEVPSFDGEKIECFLLSPETASDNAPCLVYNHGGGFVLPAAGYHYKNAMYYAKEGKCKVFFVNYRLAPKHPHPVFFEDCYAAACWAYGHAGELGIDPSRMGIGGDSAGAALSVGVIRMAQERSHPLAFLFQMLPYPYLDARGDSRSNQTYTDTPMWNATLSARVWPMVQAKKDTPEYLYFSPLEADSFHGLPPAYIETAEFDCLHDDGILYAQKLRETGTPVVLNETRGTMHGFDIVHRAKTTRAALAARVAFIRQHFSIE